MTTYVLVHGAWLGGWVWKRVLPHLERDGNKVYTPTLTGMGERVHLASPDVGMETAIKDVLNVVKDSELDDFVLVGHSFAGKVVAGAADLIAERVRTVLYLDAFRPEKVRTPQGGFNPGEFGKIEPGQWTIPLNDRIIDAIGKDVQGPDREWLLSMATPWPVKLARDPITLSERSDSLKNAYIFCTQSGDPVDEIVQGKWGALEGPYRLIESGHWPMITKPKELADDLMALAG